MPSAPASATHFPSAGRWPALVALVGLALAAGSGQAQDAPPAADPARPAAMADAGNRFDVMEYLVQGNSVLPVLDIEEAVYPFLGPSRTVEDVEAARAALEQRYAERGFVTVAVNIPEQRVENGTVSLEVVEARVGRLRVRGSRYYSLGRIIAAAPSLAEGTVPQVAAVQQDADRLNRLPGRRVTPVLKPGRAPQTVDADLNIEDEPPWHASLELNNQKSADTEPLRLVASLAYDNLFQLGHTIRMQYQTAPQDRSEVEVFSGSYTFRVPEWRQSLLIYGYTSGSDVATVGGINSIGDGFAVGARAILPLPNRGNFSHSVLAGLDYKDFDDSQEFGEDQFKTPINYVPLTLDYIANLRDATGLASARLGATVGSGIGSDRDDFERKRANARPNFAYLRFGADRNQLLPGGFEIDARLDGQLTEDALINNEQFAAGGVASVRGYLEAEELGDNGIGGVFQLSTPNLGARLPVAQAAYLQDWRLYGFVDGAHLRQTDTLPGEDKTFNLVSVGVGTRLDALEYLRAAVDLAVPLSDTERTHAGDVRVLFSLEAGL